MPNGVIHFLRRTTPIKQLRKVRATVRRDVARKGLAKGLAQTAFRRRWGIVGITARTQRLIQGRTTRSRRARVSRMR